MNQPIYPFIPCPIIDSLNSSVLVNASIYRILARRNNSGEKKTENKEITDLGSSSDLFPFMLLSHGSMQYFICFFFV